MWSSSFRISLDIGVHFFLAWILGCHQWMTVLRAPQICFVFIVHKNITGDMHELLRQSQGNYWLRGQATAPKYHFSFVQYWWYPFHAVWEQEPLILRELIASVKVGCHSFLILHAIPRTCMQSVGDDSLAHFRMRKCLEECWRVEYWVYGRPRMTVIKQVCWDVSCRFIWSWKGSKRYTKIRVSRLYIKHLA